MTVQDVVPDNSTSLADGRGSFVSPSGPHGDDQLDVAIARLLHEIQTVGNAIGEATSAWMADWLGRVEPELAELRQRLSAAAD